MTTKLALKTTVLLAALAACLPAANATAETADQQQIAAAMRRAFDWQIANRTTTKFPVDNSQGPRGWVHGAFMTGIMEAARTTGDPAYLDYAWKIAADNSWQLGPRFEHGDDHIIGQSYLELHEIDPARANIKPTIETFDRLLAKHYDGAKLLWWCDSLYMHPQVWARLAKATGDKKYLDEMDRLYWASVDYLYDKGEHLFFRDKNYMPHDKDFKPTRDKKGVTTRFIEANGQKMFWSRGNGWVFAGLPRIMNYIPATDPRRAKYEKLFKQMAARIAALQSPDGLWRMGLLNPDAYGRGEESGSAFFIYGLAWGVRTGLLDAATYRPVIERGWRALLACQQPDGMIGYVQPIGAAPGEHSAKTNQEYGTGGFLLAASEMYKLAATTTAAAASATAQQPTPLFNGKNLDGWIQRGGKAKYTVENREIVGTTVTNTENSFLCTVKNYGDFILELDFKVDARLNSGVQIRSECFDTPKQITWRGQTIKIPARRVHGYQVEIDPDKGNRVWCGGIYDEARRKWLFPVEKKQQDKLSEQGNRIFKPGDWNHLRVEAIGDSIKTYLNGELRTDIIDSMTPRGFIALQVHGIGKDASRAGIQARFRNITITSFDDAPAAAPAPNTLTPAEKATGWKLLWDGKTTDGWRSAKAGTFPAAGWKIQNGVLTVQANKGEESAAGGDIITRARYSDFELRLDFKITPGANSGIKYFVQPNLDPITGTGAKAAVGSAIGLEYQILDDALHPDAKLGRDGDRTLGSLYDLIPAAADKKPNPIGEWNAARIVVRGNHVEHWLNGEKILEYDRGSPDFRSAVALSKYKNIPAFGEWPDGHILLQEHGDEVSFRNIKILVPAE